MGRVLPSQSVLFVLSSSMHLTHFEAKPMTNPARMRHVHDDIELAVISRGRGLQLVGDAEEACAAGEVFIFPVGCRHMSATGPDQHFLLLAMNVLPSELPGEAGSMLAGLARRAERGCKLPVRPSTGQRVAAMLHRAFREWSSSALGSRSAAVALAMESVVALARDVADEPSVASAGDQHVATAVRWLEDYWMGEIGIADLVALGPLARSQFLARFRAVNGCTVGDMLLRIRLREAQRMMREGRHNLLEIALACGFGSQSHFNHRFKRATGLSPRAWLAQPAPRV